MRAAHSLKIRGVLWCVHVDVQCACTRVCHPSVAHVLLMLYRRILDDLSSADATLKAAGTDPLALAAAATLQAQQVTSTRTCIMYMFNNIMCTHTMYNVMYMYMYGL